MALELIFPEQSIIRVLNPSSGRMLLYVWAVEQDELSKRVVPDSQSTSEAQASLTSLKAQDVLVPWVKTPQSPSTKPKAPSLSLSSSSDPPQINPPSPSEEPHPPSTPQVFQRYYHLFAESELSKLTVRAALELGIIVGNESELGDEETEMNGKDFVHGIEILKTGWERSNYYLEARTWARRKGGS